MFKFHLNVYPKGMVTEIQLSFFFLRLEKLFASLFIIIALKKEISCQKKRYVYPRKNPKEFQVINNYFTEK